MKPLHFSFARFVGLLLLAFGFHHCDKAENIIITDDIIMLVVPATGLEDEACDNFIVSRAAAVPPQDSQRVAWTEAKSLSGDTTKIVRLEILRDTGSVVKFTMVLQVRKGVPSEIRCMKGFGCTGTWEGITWKSPNGNFLEHPTHKFRVVPTGSKSFVVENKLSGESITVRVNPPL
mgnify:CR=1 FL=1